jgi:hypothetical protein
VRPNSADRQKRQLQLNVLSLLPLIYVEDSKCNAGSCMSQVKDTV